MDVSLLLAASIVSAALLAAILVAVRLHERAADARLRQSQAHDAELRAREQSMALRREVCLDALAAVAHTFTALRHLREPLPPATAHGAGAAPDALGRLLECTERAKAIASPATAALFEQYAAQYASIHDQLGVMRGRAGSANDARSARVLLDAMPQLSALSNNLLLAVRKDFGFSAQSEHMLWQQLNKAAAPALASWRQQIEAHEPAAAAAPAGTPARQDTPAQALAAG